MSEDGSREYPFHSRSEKETVKSLFDQKLAANKLSGAKVAESGEYAPFSGFKREAFDKLFVLELQLSETTKKEITERIVTPLKEIAEDLGIADRMIFAGDGDQEPHITMHVGSFKNMSEEKQEQIRKWLSEGSGDNNEHMSHLNRTAEILTGLKFDMDTIFNSGRDTSITASADGRNQGAAYRARKIFEKALVRAQNKFATDDEKIAEHYARYDDIFHTSVARYTGVVEPEKLQAFNERIEKEIAPKLFRKPIAIEVSNARTIIATQGVNERKPSLLS